MTAIFQRRLWSARGSLSLSSRNWTRSSSAMRFVQNRGRLGRRRLAGGHARNGDAKSRAPSKPRFERQSATQLLGDQIEYDMQAKAGSALVAACREEWVKGAALDLLAHPDSVVGNEDVDVIAYLTRFHRDGSRPPVRKGMDHAIEKKVGQDLPVGPGIAVHHDAGRHIDGERDLGLFQHGAQAGDDMVGRLPKIELSAVRVAAVDGNLFEGLNKLARALKIGHQLVGGIPSGLEEVVEPRPAQRSQVDFFCEIIAPARKARGHRKADTDRIVDLVRNASDQTAECGELFGSDEILLRLAQIFERFFGALLRSPQLILGLALGDGIFTEYGYGTGHFADFIARLRSLDRRVVFLRHDGMHRIHDRPQRQD